MNKTILFVKSSITLILPSGNEYTVAPGDYSFDDVLAKATQLAPGQRWITVHPNGPGTKGVPVMVQESQHGSGVFHVIGGAGGKLNYLKLSGIKPESSYKQEASERAKAKAEIKKVQRERDKELGLDKGKGAAREAVQHQKHQAQKAFISKVAGKMGWSEDDLKPKIPENTTLLATKKLEQKHHSALLEKANKAVDLQVQHLMADTQARQEAGIVPIANEHTPDDQLSTADLEDARPQEKASLGFAAHYAERAEEKGSDEASIKAEADDKKKARQALMTDNQRSAIKVRGTIAKQVQAEIANIREPITKDVKAVMAAATDAVELIKARKAMQAVNKAAQDANKDIDESKEVKAYNLEVSEASDDQIASDIENDLRTARTTAFLSTIKKEVSEPEKQLRQHIGAGAFNSINGLAVAGTGAALVDRSVVDVLGIAGAAQVLARRLHADLPADEVEKLTSGMEDYHLHHYMETSKNAMQEAQDLHDTAKEIGLGEASHGADFEAARELNSKRKDCIEEAHKILGTALGEMEANAALITAMKGGRSEKPFECPMGKISDEDAIRQVRAIGLNRGDYSIDKVAGNQVLTITPQGMDKLSSPVDKADMERTRNTLSILNGEQDEDDWLPQGFAKRPDLAMNLKPGVAATLAKPFKPGADLGQSLKDYIGGRTADGDSPADIMADIQSSDFFDKAGNNDAYREALDSVAPLKGKDGKQARAETLSDTFNQYADNYVQDNYGGKISTLQRQNFEPDKVAQEALHRALSDEPAGIAAYKPIGELSNDDQRTLRQHFYTHVAHESPEAASLRTRLEGMAAHEPEKESTDMFGDTATNPEWTDWKAQRDTLAEEVGSASLDWQKYAGAMHGHENAYASVQDLIKSKIAQSFNENYNKLNPSAPLKLGRQVIRNNLNHLDAVDPAARAQREAEERQLIDGLRERVQGKYASGSVMDKLDATRESKEAFEQAQMGFFSAEQDGDMFGGDDTAKPGKPLAADQRNTLGHAAERTIAGMVPLIGKNFKPGQPVKLFNPTMSGEGIMRQRSIKFIAANKRVALGAGTGAGKTAMFLGAFSHLQSQGKVKKGVMVVPSIVIGQVGAEATRFLEPGKFKWHCEPGASFESRMAGYKDPDTHFSVVTHQSFRDDLLKMASMKTGEEPGAVADRMESMTRKERATFTKEVLDHHGINFDFSTVDEGHGLLDRKGKENSRMSNAIGGVTDNTGYTVSATADLVKNDMCLHPDTPIQDATSGESHTVKEWADLQIGPNVHALDVSTGDIHIQQAGVPFLKSKNRPMFCVSLKNGRQITVAGSHQFLTPGGWMPLSVLDAGSFAAVPQHSSPQLPSSPKAGYSCEPQSLLQSVPSVVQSLLVGDCALPQTSSALFPQKTPGLSSWLTFLPVSRRLSSGRAYLSLQMTSLQSALRTFFYRLVRDVCALHCLQITPNYQYGYSADCSLCDGQPQLAAGNVQAPFPSPVDALQQFRLRKREDVPCKEPGHKPQSCVGHLSKNDDRHPYLSQPASLVSACTESRCEDNSSAQCRSSPLVSRPSAQESRQQDTKPQCHCALSQEDFGCQESGNFHHVSYKNNVIFDKIYSIVQVKNADVYDLSVPVFHNYLACGIWNHNSEAGSLMEKLEPEKHGDRGAFMRRYGVDTQGAKDALKREMLNSVISYKLDPKGVTANKQEISVKPSEAQSKALAELDKNIGAVRMARMEGKTNVEAMKAISPHQFKDVPEEQHEALAKELASSLGIIKGSAVRNILDSHPDSAKIDALAKIAGERKGKPGVVFAHSLAAVENIKKRLEADGHRVITLTGGDSSADKADKIRAFNPDKGDRTHDIMVASDAGSTGANLQSGQWLTQFDSPLTAMSHAQRQGRINRVGQKNQNIELMDLIADHPSERAARERLKTKYALRELMSSPYESGDDTGLAHFLQQRKVEQQNALI